MHALDLDTLLIEQKPLHAPALSELGEVLSDGLKKNFGSVFVSEVVCPDLTAAPFNLAGAGLSGNPTIVDIGGPAYLLPTADRSKLYDLVAVGRKVLSQAAEFVAIGAGAGPFPHIKSNSEGIFNLKLSADGSVVSETNIAHIAANGKCELSKLPNTETRCALLANLFYSEGKPGKVLRVKCKQRIGAEDFITSCRNVLAKHYKDKVIGLGGVFVLRSGKAKHFVMPNFSDTPIYTEEELQNWLTFHEISSTLTTIGTLITDAYDLDLRLQHFHSFSANNAGGHFDYDTTPETVEYEAYFNVAERVVRIDKPIVTHKFGRD